MNINDLVSSTLDELEETGPSGSVVQAPQVGNAAQELDEVESKLHATNFSQGAEELPGASSAMIGAMLSEVFSQCSSGVLAELLTDMRRETETLLKSTSSNAAAERIRLESQVSMYDQLLEKAEKASGSKESMSAVITELTSRLEALGGPPESVMLRILTSTLGGASPSSDQGGRSVSSSADVSEATKSGSRTKGGEDKRQDSATAAASSGSDFSNFLKECGFDGMDANMPSLTDDDEKLLKELLNDEDLTKLLTSNAGSGKDKSGSANSAGATAPGCPVQ